MGSVSNGNSEGQPIQRPGDAQSVIVAPSWYGSAVFESRHGWWRIPAIDTAGRRSRIAGGNHPGLAVTAQYAPRGQKIHYADVDRRLWYGTGRVAGWHLLDPLPPYGVRGDTARWSLPLIPSWNDAPGSIQWESLQADQVR